MSLAGNKETTYWATVSNDDETLVVDEVFFPPQVGTGASTNICGKYMADLQREMHKQKRILGCWIHTHPTFQTYFSSIDMETIREIGGNGWLLALVYNNKGDIHAGYYQRGDDFIPKVFSEGFDVQIGKGLSGTTREGLNKDFKEKFKEPVRVVRPSPITLTGSRDTKKKKKKFRKLMESPKFTEEVVGLCNALVEDYEDITFDQVGAEVFEFWKGHDKLPTYFELETEIIEKEVLSEFNNTI
jgi:proteasome lid subunit RPN8/RPN11